MASLSVDLMKTSVDLSCLVLSSDGGWWCELLSVIVGLLVNGMLVELVLVCPFKHYASLPFSQLQTGSPISRLARVCVRVIIAMTFASLW